MTPLLEYIKEKADKKRQDREQRRETRRKREEERKKARDDERKRKREKKEQEIREREIRDRDKKEKPTNRSGNSRQQHKSIDVEKRNTEKFENRNKINKDVLSNEGVEKSGRRGTKGTKNSSEITHDSRSTSINDKAKFDAENPTAKAKDNDIHVDEGESGKSSNKYASKSRNKDDRRRVKDERDVGQTPRDERAVKSREGKQQYNIIKDQARIIYHFILSNPV